MAKHKKIAHKTAHKDHAEKNKKDEKPEPKKESAKQHKKLSLKDHFNIFAGSFKKINVSYSWIILFNLLFVLVAYGLVFLWSYLNNRYANSIGVPTNYAALAPSQLATVSAQIQQLYSFIVATAVILVLLLLLFWSLLEGLAWHMIYKSKMGWKNYKGFASLNLVWFIVWSIPLAGILAYATYAYNPSFAIYGT